MAEQRIGHESTFEKDRSKFIHDVRYGGIWFSEGDSHTETFVAIADDHERRQYYAEYQAKVAENVKVREENEQEKYQQIACEFMVSEATFKSTWQEFHRVLKNKFAPVTVSFKGADVGLYQCLDMARLQNDFEEHVTRLRESEAQSNLRRLHTSYN